MKHTFFSVLDLHKYWRIKYELFNHWIFGEILWLYDVQKNITLDEAFDIAWSNAQKGLYSVIESDTHAIYINCDLFDEYTTDIYDLMEAE